MTQQVFNHIILHGTDQEALEAMQEHPDLLETCSEEIRARVKESPFLFDEQDVQRLRDHGLEEVENYSYFEDL